MPRVWFVMFLLMTASPAHQASEAQPLLPDGQRLLIWAEPLAGAPGQLLLLGGDEPQPVLIAANAASSAGLCGTQATSPDGRHVAFSVADGPTTTLYLMTDASPQLRVLSNNINPMTCVGTGVDYDPTSARVAYLMWPSPADAAIAPVARLLIHETGSVALVGNFENVADFELSAEGAAFVTMFRNAQNDYVEVGVNLWDGTSTRELTTLVADQANECFYTSASIAIVNAETLAVTVGVRCRRGVTTTQYQIYSVDVPSRVASLLLQGATKTQFVPFVQNNQTLVAPNQDSLFVLLPDNLRLDTGVLIETPRDTPAERVLIPGAIQTALVNRIPDNSTPSTSPDGRWLSLVTSDANANRTLYAYDMDAPTVPPIIVSGSSRGDRFSSLLFTADSAALVYLAGTEEFNAVFVLNLTTGISSRVVRGRFDLHASAISPFTPTLALVDSRTITDDQPRYDTLVMVDLASGAVTDLLVGATLADNLVSDQLELVPIAWRKPGDSP